MEFRSQLGRVRGLGASHEGAHHFWVQRVSGIALVPLVIWFVLSASTVVSADLVTFKAWVGTHYNPVLLILLILTMFHHAFLGLQVIIEDYIHAESIKLTSLIVTKFALYLIGACAIFAVIRLTFGS
ncbi:MAG: succinate dehydrogenase, hydrophobic membrane anchor protein [Beijerinckiaceae bacterium]|jgi:succinate dehydrogenase / fumarate reductase, membrane anchor subunit|nr:succinate dehydrogenase, hydrophobic membrane anchor protein [Beijerinckiaceae bacterium]